MPALVVVWRGANVVSTILAMPKSAKMAPPYSSNNMLAGFRSRKMMFWLCISTTPRQISNIHWFTFACGAFRSMKKQSMEKIVINLYHELPGYAQVAFPMKI